MIGGRTTGVCAGVVTLVLVGCVRNEPSVTPEPSGTTGSTDAGETQLDGREGEPASTSVCGTPAQRFADYAWVPDDSRSTTSIVRDDRELPEALQTLARMADDAGVQLPIRAAIGYRNLGFQLAGLERVLATVELDPGELVELHSPAGDVVWLWPSDCPTADLAARVLERCGVLMRLDFEHPGMRVGEGSLERFPFDVVLVRERIVALAPLGRGAAVSTWLSAAREDEDGPGVALANIEAAPIRSVLSGPSLLSGSEATSSTGRHRKLRVTTSAYHEES